MREFEEETDWHPPAKGAPSLLNIRKALEDCRRLLEPIVAAKRAQEPDPEVGSSPVTASCRTNPEFHHGVAGPEAGQESPVANGVGSAGLDFGRMLMDFQRRAEELAETGKLLTENRQKHAELKAAISTLDAEYVEMSTRLSKSQEYYQLLSRLLELHNGAAARAGNGS